MADRDIPQIGVDIYTPDFQTIARGFGCRALRAESLAHLRDALREAVAAERPDGDRDRRRGRAGVDMSTRALTERPASLFVNGAFRPASGGDRLSVVDPSTGQPFAEIACADAADVEAAVAAATRRLPVLGAASGGRAGGLPAPHRGRPASAGRTPSSQLQMLNNGKPRAEAEIDVGDAVATFDYYAGLAEGLDARQGEPVPMPDAGLRRQDPLRAGRAGRHDRALELPAGHQRLEDRAGAGRRLHRGAQDLRVHPADRARLRRHRPGGGAARRRAQPDHRRRRGRRRADPRPAAAQALLHRLEPGRRPR